MIKTIKTITAITIKIPKPIPALKIVSIASQLVNKVIMNIKSAAKCTYFFMFSIISDYQIKVLVIAQIYIIPFL